MSQRSRKIADSLRHISHAPIEVLSGVVVSVDSDAITCEVRPTLYDDADGDTITVNLHAISGTTDSYILYPAANSDVVIASIDGPGEYVLIRASTIDKVVITINGTTHTIDGTQAQYRNGDTTHTINTSGLSLKANNKDLATIMQNLLAALIALTVETPAGTSSVPVNIQTLTQIQTDLKNILF